MKTHVDFPERHFKRIQVLGALFSASLLLCPKWAMVSRGSLGSFWTSKSKGKL